MRMCVILTAFLTCAPALAGAQLLPTGNLATTPFPVTMHGVGAPAPDRTTVSGEAADVSVHAAARLGGAGRSGARLAAQTQGTAAPSANRKGFIIGFGGGVGMHQTADITVRNQAGTVIFSEPGTRTFGLATELKIGWAFTDQILTYYVNKASFAGSEDYDVVGLTGVGVTYMARRTSPSPFVTGAIGAATGASLLGTSDAGRGTAFSIGGGFEFRRRWSVDADVMFARLGDGDNHTVIRGGIHYLWY